MRYAIRHVRYVTLPLCSVCPPPCGIQLLARGRHCHRHPEVPLKVVLTGAEVLIKKIRYLPCMSFQLFSVKKIRSLSHSLPSISGEFVFDQSQDLKVQM